MSLCTSVYMCFVVTCWERADLLALVCGVCCEFVTFITVSLPSLSTPLAPYTEQPSMICVNFSGSLMYESAVISEFSRYRIPLRCKI